jgi:hypothetical protein
MGLGLACTGRTLSWADAASGKMPLQRTPNGDRLETVPAGQLLSFALNKSEKVKGAYRYAVDNEDALRYIPCFCGCKNIGHQHNGACYVSEHFVDGQVTFNSHAVG